MTITAETINHIGNLAIAAQQLPATHTPVTALPDGVSIKSLEAFQQGRARFRGHLSTTSIRDFADYSIAVDGKHAAGFVDQDKMACTIFFNLGTTAEAGHADHRATLQLKPTALYTALQKIAGQGLTQRQIAEWLEDWRDSLNITDENGDPMTAALAIAAVRDIKMKATSERSHTEGDFSASRSAMDAIEAAAKDRTPSEITVHVTPYEGLPSVEVTLRLSIITGEQPLLKPRWVREEKQREEIAKSFKDVLKQEVGGSATLTIGTFNPGA